MRSTFGERIYQVIAWVIVGLTMLTCLVPAYYVLITSFVTKAEIQISGGYVLFPHEFQLVAYQAFLRNENVLNAFLISIARVFCAVALQLIVCSLAGYALCKQTLPGRKVGLIVVILSMMIGPGMIPNYLWSLQNGTYNTFWFLILPQAYSAFGIILFRQFFMALPDGLIEAADIDGAKEHQIVRYIVLPLSTPIFATIALFCAVGNWNDFTSNLIYVPKQSLMTLAFFLQQSLTGIINLQANDNGAFTKAGTEASNVAAAAPSEAYKMAAVIMGTLPIVAVYPFLQKYFAHGMLTGAIKG